MCDQYHAKRDASEASGFLMFRLASCCMAAKRVSIFVPFSAHALPHVGQYWNGGNEALHTGQGSPSSNW